MIEVSSCPVCGSADLHEVGASEYRHADAPPAAGAGREWADRVQRDFVFSEWLPGRRAVTLRELLCLACGLLVYSPRPTQADVERKYELLVQYGVPLGAADAEPRRAEQIRDRLAPHLPGPTSRILDVGGGDGRLLAALRDAGASCFLADYSDSQVPGVTKLGDTIDDIDPGERFDAVILSHVLEHVADPASLVRRARGLAGAFYAEVPVEIWRTTPVGVDPVTHINHFTKSSLNELLRRSGWTVAATRGQFGTYAGAPLEIAWAVGTTGPDGPSGPVGEPAREALRRLAPSLPARVARRARGVWHARS